MRRLKTLNKTSSVNFLENRLFISFVLRMLNKFSILEFYVFLYPRNHPKKREKKHETVRDIFFVWFTQAFDGCTLLLLDLSTPKQKNCIQGNAIQKTKKRLLAFFGAFGTIRNFV